MNQEKKSIRAARMKEKKAFTLVELLVVIAILGILATVSVVGYSTYMEKARLANDESFVSQINTLLMSNEIVTNGTPNDGVEIQQMLKENGATLTTQSKGNYIFYNENTHQAELCRLGEKGLVTVFPEASSSKTKSFVRRAASTDELSSGDYLPYITSPEEFAKDYWFITESSRDGFAESISAIRESETKEALASNIEAVNSYSNPVYNALTGLATHAGFVNDYVDGTTSRYTIVKEGTNYSDVTELIFCPHIKKITANQLDNIDQMSLSFLDFPSSVEDIDDEALEKIETIAADVYITTSSDQLLSHVETYAAGLGDSERASTLLGAFVGAEDKQSHVKTVCVSFYNDDGGITEAESYYDKICEVNDKQGEVSLPRMLDSQFFQTDGNLLKHFDGFYVKDGTKAIDIQTGKYEISDAFASGIPDKITVYAKYSAAAASDSTLSLFGYDTSDDQSDSAIAVNDSLLWAAANSNCVSSLLTGFDNYVVYQNSTSYTLMQEVTIPNNLTLWVPYNSTFESQNSKYCYNSSYTDLLGFGFDQTRSFYGNSGRSSDALGTFSEFPADYVFTVANTVKNYGSVIVGANLFAGEGGKPYAGTISGKYGKMIVESSFTNYGSLTAYGQIVVGEAEDGTIISELGTVTEMMEVTDFHGGSDLIGCVLNDVFPFNQWRLDRIAGTLKIKKQSNYHAMVLLYAKKYHCGGIDLIGDNGGLFTYQTDDSHISKKYIDGRLQFMLNGNIHDSAVSMSAGGYEIDLSSIPFALPNLDVIIASGSKCTLSANQYKLLPGASILVEQNSELHISSTLGAYEKFIRTEIDAACKQYPTTDENGNGLAGAVFKVAGSVFLEGSAFSGDINLSSSGKIYCSSSLLPSTSFAEGYGKSSGCGYSLVQYSSVITGSNNGVDYDSLVNFTKITLGEIRYFISTNDELNLMTDNLPEQFFIV